MYMGDAPGCGAGTRAIVADMTERREVRRVVRERGGQFLVEEILTRLRAEGYQREGDQYRFEFVYHFHNHFILK